MNVSRSTNCGELGTQLKTYKNCLTNTTQTQFQLLLFNLKCYVAYADSGNDADDFSPLPHCRVSFIWFGLIKLTVVRDL